ncbi:hypothetical protein Xen7305DRAFT_00036800 [Xenococcus sp. PCC 7305]|nr:hypothetical protein Xen7305DRAFT_00036800 [Xenococcus sp. PCC 7305]
MSLSQKIVGVNDVTVEVEVIPSTGSYDFEKEIMVWK